MRDNFIKYVSIKVSKKLKEKKKKILIKKFIIKFVDYYGFWLF